MQQLSSTVSTNAEVYRIEELARLVHSGNIRVPQFQRNFRWSHADVLALFDSILKGYPIGNLLLWKHEVSAEQVRVGEVVIDAPSTSDALSVVDGQQRVTAIVNGVSTDAYDANDRFRIDYDFKKHGFVTGRGSSDDHTIPLPDLFDLRKLLAWASAHPDLAEYVIEANDVATKLRDFKVPASIVTGSDESALREVFDRINNSGKRLRRAEVFHALFSHSETNGDSVKAISDRLLNLNFGIIDDNTILHSILARRHFDITRDLRREFEPDRKLGLDVLNGETQEEAFAGGSAGLEAAILFLQRHAGVPHVAFLPYKSLLVVLTRFFSHHREADKRTRLLLSRWFWRAALAPTLFRGSATATMRNLNRLIKPGDVHGSVQRLLETVPDDGTYAYPSAARFKTNEASTKIILCAMYDNHPRRIADGQRIDRGDLAMTINIDYTAVNAVSDLIDRSQLTDQLSLSAGRKFLLIEDDVDLTSAREFLLSSSTGIDDTDESMRETRRSHFILNEYADLAARNDFKELVRARETSIHDHLKAFLDKKMALRFPGNGSLAQFDLD